MMKLPWRKQPLKLWAYDKTKGVSPWLYYHHNSFDKDWHSRNYPKIVAWDFWKFYPLSPLMILVIITTLRFRLHVLPQKHPWKLTGEHINFTQLKRKIIWTTPPLLGSMLWCILAQQVVFCKEKWLEDFPSPFFGGRLVDDDLAPMNIIKFTFLKGKIFKSGESFKSWCHKMGPNLIVINGVINYNPYKWPEINEFHCFFFLTPLPFLP